MITLMKKGCESRILWVELQHRLKQTSQTKKTIRIIGHLGKPKAHHNVKVLSDTL